MLKIFGTNVVISKGYNGAPALKYSDKGTSVFFQVGNRIYDTREENNTRWMNLQVKAFGPVCERIKKMQIKEGSFINLVGHLDEDSWNDSSTGEKKSKMVIILDEIEYASPGNGKSKESNAASTHNTPPATASNVPQESSEAPGQFTGFQAFDAFSGANSFFDN